MFNDLRYALRMLAKNPGFVVVAILSLAIGIGANSAMYSFADLMLLRPLPIAKPSEVVALNAPKNGTFGFSRGLSNADYLDLRDKNRTFDGLVAWAYSPFGFAPTPSAQPHMKFSMFVSGNFFHVLGVEPSVGRGFQPEEDRVAGRDAVVVISYDLWRDEFGASPSALGQKVKINGTEFTIVGVAPETFTGVDILKPAMYVPLAMAPVLWQDKDILTKRDNRWLTVKARLKPGVGIAQAQADVSSLVGALRGMYPQIDDGLQLNVETDFQTRVENSPPDTALVVMLALLAGCVLLVACANVAGLLLSRASVRTREIAVRLAMGARRATIVRQLLVENLLLAIGGGAAGLILAQGMIKFFNTIPFPSDIPLNFNFQLDDRALTFTLVVSVISTFVFGLVPALHGTRLELASTLKERSATSSRMGSLWGRNVIVAGQVALSLVLLMVSGVLIAGFNWQLAQGPGYRTDHLQVMNLNPGLIHYTDAEDEVFYKQLLDQTKQLSGVENVALTSSLPMSPSGLNVIGTIPEGHVLKRGEHAAETFDSVVSPEYFATMAIPLLQGRSFLASDTAKSTQVAIVNEELAHHYWPGQNAIGKRLRLKDDKGKLVEIIGVAKMSKYVWISEAPTDFLYLPFAQNQQPNMTLLAQSKSSNAASLVPALRHIVDGLNRDMPVFDIRTMESLYESRAVTTPRIITRAVSTLGLMGLILSVIGLYGVVSYSVNRRSREFGIRMAVGADRWQIVGMVLQQGMKLGVVGLAVGLVAGMFATSSLGTTGLFTFPIGVLPIVTVSVLLLVAVALSAYLPARRASLVDPMRALREE